MWLGRCLVASLTNGARAYRPPVRFRAGHTSMQMNAQADALYGREKKRYWRIDVLCRDSVRGCYEKTPDRHPCRKKPVPAICITHHHAAQRMRHGLRLSAGGHPSTQSRFTAGASAPQVNPPARVEVPHIPGFAPGRHATAGRRNRPIPSPYLPRCH